MSWSISRMGTKAKVAERVAADFDERASNYAGTPEEKDILAAKDRALSAIEDLDLVDKGDAWTAGVKVEANGSRSRYSTSINVTVTRLALEM